VADAIPDKLAAPEVVHSRQLTPEAKGVTAVGHFVTIPLTEATAGALADTPGLEVLAQTVAERVARVPEAAVAAAVTGFKVKVAAAWAYSGRGLMARLAAAAGRAVFLPLVTAA
jgi:hypothetical protein